LQRCRQPVKTALLLLPKARFLGINTY